MRLLNTLLTVFLFTTFHAGWGWWLALVIITLAISVRVLLQMNADANLAENKQPG